jgi:DNA-binding response OmpR family regulator
MALAQDLADGGFVVMGPTSSCRAAEALIKADGLPSAAVLDVTLRGGTTSESLARLLGEAGCPVVFATGYTDLEWLGEFPGAPLLKKPTDPQELRRVLTRLIDEHLPAGCPELQREKQ